MDGKVVQQIAVLVAEHGRENPPQLVVGHRDFVLDEAQPDNGVPDVDLVFVLQQKHRFLSECFLRLEQGIRLDDPIGVVDGDRQELIEAALVDDLLVDADVAGFAL